MNRVIIELAFGWVLIGQQSIIQPNDVYSFVRSQENIWRIIVAASDGLAPVYHQVICTNQDNVDLPVLSVQER